MHYVMPRILRALRERAELTQTDLAGRLGVTASAVNQVEREDSPMREAVFAKYAEAIGYPDELDALADGVALLRPPPKAPVKTKARKRAGGNVRKAAPRRRAEA